MDLDGQTTAYSVMDGAIPLSLYVHFPWCARKCPYCDFNSHEFGEGIPEAAYIQALLADLEQHLGEIWGRRVDTIFIGGGTPSLISPEGLDELLAQLRARLPIRPDAEITMEANPGTAEQGRFRAYREAGVNRLSLGIQSFEDAKLAALGRIHDGRQALKAVEAAQQAGFTRLNLDLMFGLPGQSTAQAMADLRQALAQGLKHLSWYQLTLEPNTAFAHRPPELPDEDRLWAIQSEGEELLNAAGLYAYEVSAWSLADEQCRHNLNYWQFGDYLGIGAGAHGKLTDMASGEIWRHWKQRSPQRYLAKAARADVVAGRRQLLAADRLLEFMMNALRLHQGFEPQLFAARTGLPMAMAEEGMREAIGLGMLERMDELIRPTELGRQHLNRLLQCFMGD